MLGKHAAGHPRSALASTTPRASAPRQAYYSRGIVLVYHNNSKLAAAPANRALILPNTLGLPDFYTPAAQVSPFVPGMWALGMKDHRFVRSRQLAIDEAIRQNRTTMTGLQFKPAEFASMNRTRPLSVLFSPLHYLDPATGKTNITGIASNSFNWDSLLNGKGEKTPACGASPLLETPAERAPQTPAGTIPRICSLYVVLYSPDLEANLNFSGMAARNDEWGFNPPVADTSMFTIKLTNGVASNLGWGDLRPDAARGSGYFRSWTHQLGDRTPYVFLISPTEEFAAFYETDTPEHTSIAAVLIVWVRRWRSYCTTRLRRGTCDGSS